MKKSVNSSLILHPQAENYRRQNLLLQAEMARLIAELDCLKFTIASNIAAEYRSKIGALEWRVFQMDCETRAMLRRIEMARGALNRGDAPCFRCIEREIEAEFTAWRASIASKAREIRDAKKRETLPKLSFAESRELQTLYRKLAFSLHPDITGAADKRRQKLWLQTTEAYRNGDLDTLRTICLLIGEATGADSPAGNILENLQTRNAELKKMCARFLGEISAIKSAAPYIWREILADAPQIAEIQADLRGKIANLREQRRELTRYWAEVMRFAKDREEIEIPAEPPDIFADAEDDWAEIIG